MYDKSVENQQKQGKVKSHRHRVVQVRLRKVDKAGRLDWGRIGTV
jgi:hypothetical protein